jgi:hypothetical protein
MLAAVSDEPDSVVHTIILKDDRRFPPDRIGAGPLPHLATN